MRESRNYVVIHKQPVNINNFIISFNITTFYNINKKFKIKENMNWLSANCIIYLLSIEMRRWLRI